jgi:hypothetical protein
LRFWSYQQYREKFYFYHNLTGLTDILHLSQQDLKNRVYQRRIKPFRLQQLQEARFLVLVQDMS